MNGWLMVRVVLTLLVVGFWSAFAWRGYGGTWGIADAPVAGHPYTGSIASPPYPAPMPNGVEPGDRFDRRSIPVEKRIELFLTVPKIGSTLHLRLQRGESTRDFTLVAAPQPPPSFLDWVLVANQVLYTLLGLVLVWRGRDWVAWGLAAFALAFAMKDVVGYVLPSGAALWAMLPMRAVRDLGLYVTVRQLAGTALPRPAATVSLWTMLGVILTYELMTLSVFLGYVIYARFSVGPEAIIGHLLTAAAAICLVTLAVGYRRSDELRRLRMRWVLVATLFHSTAFAIWGLEPFWIPATLILVAVACFAYAALRHKLVDLSFAISRTLIYGTVVALVVGVFAIVEHAIATRAIGERAGIVLHLIVPLVLGITLHKLRERIEHVIERVFFRRQFEAERALLRLAHESAYVEQEDTLITRTLDDILTHVGPCSVAIYRRIDGAYECAGLAGQPGWPEHINVDDHAFVALRSGVEEQALSFAPGALGRSGIVFPMSIAGRLEGAIVCGDRAQQYTSDERQLLRRLAHDVGAALHSLKAARSERMLQALARGSISLRDVRDNVLGASD